METISITKKCNFADGNNINILLRDSEIQTNTKQIRYLT